MISPNIYNSKLWKTSGHWDHYSVGQTLSLSAAQAITLLLGKYVQNRDRKGGLCLEADELSWTLVRLSQGVQFEFIFSLDFVSA